MRRCTVLPTGRTSGSDPGPVVSTEYFRIQTLDGQPTPKKYWSVEKNCVLLNASGDEQTKLELMAKRTTGRMASVDLDTMTMTVLDCDVYPEVDYVASYPLPYKGDPYEIQCI